MNIYTRIIGASIIVLFVFISSCSNCIKGEGDPVVKILDIAPFIAIHITGSTEVNISQGMEQRVEIKAPENIIQLLKTSVVNNTWEIAFEECVRTGTLEINIITPDINAITITGSGNVKSGNNLNVTQMKISAEGSGDVDLLLNCREITTSIAGSGDVKLAGSTTNHQINISGSGNVNAFDFASVVTKIKIEGSGNAMVHATEQIEGSISGSGNIEYKDTGARVISDIQGSGDIVKK